FTGSVPSGRIMMERSGDGVVTTETLAERNKLAETGVVAAAVVLRRDTQALVAGPQLSGQGLSPDEQGVLARVAQEARAYFEELNPLLRGDDALVREELTKAVKRAFKQHTSRRTLVVPLVVRV
ncbi:ribonuclease J, partial [Corallococcus sp. AB049A]